MERRKRFLEKWLNRETLTYAICGLATTLVNLLVYRGLLLIPLDYKAANLAALISSKLFAYVVNKRYVFKSKTESFAALAKEFFRFILTRGATALVDYFGLIALVERMGLGERLSKYLIMALVIALNYFLGKWVVFKRGARDDASRAEG